MQITGDTETAVPVRRINARRPSEVSFGPVALCIRLRIRVRLLFGFTVLYFGYGAQPAVRLVGIGMPEKELVGIACFGVVQTQGQRGMKCLFLRCLYGVVFVIVTDAFQQASVSGKRIGGALDVGLRSVVYLPYLLKFAA